MEEVQSGMYVDDAFGVDLSDVLGGNEVEADQPETEETEQGDVAESGDIGSDEEGTDVAESGDEGDGSGEADQPTGESEKKFHLKWLDETRDVTEPEVVELAQKGLDYDRIRGKLRDSEAQAAELARYRDENAELVAELREFMEESGAKSVAEIVDGLRVGKLISAGVSRDVANAQVKQARAERALAKLTKQTETRNTEAEQRQKIDRDIATFQKDHPTVDLKELLPKIKDDLEQTHDLEKAYTRYELRRLEAENAELKRKREVDAKNESNRRKSAGSMKSAGTNTQTDEFLAGFNSV